VRDNREETKE